MDKIAFFELSFAPVTKYEIFLQRDSKIYIWINNQLQKVIELPAGRHSLQDFPFAGGTNEVRFEIVDDVGRQETLNYSYFSSSELLRPELHEYSYAIGAPMTELNNYERVYDGTNTTLSAFQRYGWAENLTIGANLQYDNQHFVFGGEALWATALGLFKFDPAFSSVATGSTGGAFTGNYSYSDDKGPNKSSRSFNMSLSHAGSSFITIGNPIVASRNAIARNLELAMGYSQGLGNNAAANISGAIGSYTGAFGSSTGAFGSSTGASSGELRSFTLRAGMNRKWQDGPSLNGTVSHTRNTNGSEDFSLALLLIWAFPKDKQNLSLIHGTADQSTRLDWGYNPAEGTNSSNYSAVIRDSVKEQGYSGQIAYTGNRMRSSVNQEVIINKQLDPNATGMTAATSKKTSDNVTSILFGTSIAYAGGHFAIGRPVMDTFAIVAPVKNLKGQRLDINPTSDGHYLVKSDIFGAALVPEISSYSQTEIIVNGKYLPPQMALPKDHFSIFPSYKSGYSFEVGTDATIYLTAKVHGPNDEPVALAAGSAIYLEDSSEAPITIFTNKSGTLRSEGFKPGRYRLEISSGTFTPIEIVIPESPDNNCDLGIIKLKAE